MRKKTKLFFFLGLLFVVFVSLSAIMWSPWLTEETAKQKAVSYFEEGWSTVYDGCSLTCEDCGVVGVKKVLLGQLVTLE